MVGIKNKVTGVCVNNWFTQEDAQSFIVAACKGEFELRKCLWQLNDDDTFSINDFEIIVTDDEPQNGYEIVDCGYDDGNVLMPLDDEDRNGGTVIVKMNAPTHRGFDVLDDWGNYIAHFKTREEAETAIERDDFFVE